ncbi:hypothetical protein GCM10009576_048580 [Streptomyces rhizosphaericus]|uniref:DUF2399 domain-containing protein n=2 Tax=Streptomyces rhizosphaericus TaxID=114699 RepID=A0ABP4CY52_9ACTN
MVRISALRGACQVALALSGVVGNPAVLQAAEAELGPACLPLICTEGIPSAACHRLAAAAREAGCALRRRADFYWTGLRNSSDALRRQSARPWRMTARAYQEALAEGDTVPLKGSTAPSPWEPALADFADAATANRDGTSRDPNH